MDFSKHDFLYNAYAHFAVAEKYPDGLMNAITKGGFEGFAATCWALELLTTQGELVRRDMGHDHREPIKEAQALLHMRPADMLEARRLIVDAVSRGLRTGDDNEEIDEVLQELEKKTATE